MMYVLLVFGFILLIKGADFFVDGASSIAHILKIPSVIIGLTVVAMGTSAPEAAVSIAAGITGNSDISLGNIIGSNIFNLLMVIGISAAIFPVVSQKGIIGRDMWWNIGASLALFALVMNGEISRTEGALLLLGMALYLIIVIRNALKTRITDNTDPEMSVTKSIIALVLGLAAIIAGRNMVVDNAELIAKNWGMSDSLIGLTIVAVGTSLPELVTSLTAARKGDSGIALGNAVGSCLFNILFILGLTSVITPVHAASELVADTGIMTAVSVITIVFAISGKTTSRKEGLFCILLYVAYTAYIILR